jgi:outer membrane protein assembly factor BamC
VLSVFPQQHFSFLSAACAKPDANLSSEMSHVNSPAFVDEVSSRAIVSPSGASTAVRLACVGLALSLSGCASIENFMGGDKIDYRSATVKSTGLEVPPDLTQLARDTRYQQPGTTVSAATFQSGSSTANAAATTAAPAAVINNPNIRMERLGSERWIAVKQTPEVLWPQLQAFWKERGLALVADDAAAGVMETDWAENRAKLPQDFIRNTLGRILDPLYSTGERDKFRTRVERVSGGSEIYISHRGMQEVYNSALKDSTTWQSRPTDTQLEGEFLQRLMVKLGSQTEVAKAAVTGTATGTTLPAKARLLEGRAATLQVDDGFDRAWRRVGIALDRSGFTVEDRDRSQGLYFVRYIDSSTASKEDPSFFSKLLNFGRDKAPVPPARYRVNVKAEGDRSLVAVQNDQGAPETGDAGKRIVALLLEDLK